LKPDVCRRVVGRLPSPRSKGGMAPPLSLSEEKPNGGLFCENARTWPERFQRHPIAGESHFSRLARST
jgi:hypothetical protein